MRGKRRGGKEVLESEKPTGKIGSDEKEARRKLGRVFVCVFLCV